MKKAKQPFYWFYMLKTHTHMQISYKPVVQARHDFKIFMHISKGKEVNFKFLFIQVKQVCQVKLSQSKKFSQLIY